MQTADEGSAPGANSAALLAQGRRIHALRRARGLTQEALAQSIGRSAKSVIRWENGECDLAVQDAIALCRVLNTSADALLGIAPEPDWLRRTEPVHVIVPDNLKRAMEATSLQAMDQVAAVFIKVSVGDIVVHADEWATKKRLLEERRASLRTRKR